MTATEGDVSIDVLLAAFLLDGCCGVYELVMLAVVAKVAASLGASEEAADDGIQSWRDGNGEDLEA